LSVAYYPGRVRAEFEITDHEEPVSLSVMDYAVTNAKFSVEDNHE
jgi:hypothetical protein